MKIETKYDFGDIVSLKTDDERLERIVTGMKIYPNNLVVYILNNGTIESYHYECEIIDIIKLDINCILDKINEYGIDSLNSEEKKFLDKYKK